MLLKDKVVIVTGAARGIGKAYSKGIATEGGKVVVSDIIDGEETVEEIRGRVERRSMSMSTCRMKKVWIV